VVSDGRFRPTVAFHQFSMELQCCFAVTALGDEGIEHLAFVIDGALHVVNLAVNLHKNLVDMPLRVRLTAHPLDLGLADLGGE